MLLLLKIKWFFFSNYHLFFKNYSITLFCFYQEWVIKEFYVFAIPWNCCDFVKKFVANFINSTINVAELKCAPLLTTIYIQFYFSMLLSIGFYGAHCAPLHRLCHMLSLMYSISNRDFYVFYFCALQSIIFHGAHLSLSYICTHLHLIYAFILKAE